MSDHRGHIDLFFEGITSWNDLKKAINNASVPPTAIVELTTDGSSKPELRVQCVRADWTLDEVGRAGS